MSEIDEQDVLDVFQTHDRRKRVYNSLERKEIDPFKEEYFAATSNLERKQVVCKILPKLFNIWVTTGSRRLSATQEFAQKEAKRLLGWIRNNWRAPQPTGAELKGEKHKRTTVLWRTRPDDVYKEIASILGLEHADSTTPLAFETRSRAMGNIISRMTPQEKRALDREAETLNTVEYTDEQKLKRGNKYAFKRLDEAATVHWAEMGLMNITFVARLNESGQLSVRVHDQVASTLGVVSTLFEDQKPDEVTQMKRMVATYVRGLLNARDRIRNGTRNENTTEISILDQDPDGFPLLPSNFDASKYNKEQLEELYRMYMGQNYFLATNGRSKHAPFNALHEYQSTFISPEYLPPKVRLNAPRSVSLDDLRRIMDHIYARQEIFPPSQVFRFRKVKKFRKGDETTPTNYPDEDFQSDAEKRRVPPKKPKKAAKKKNTAAPTKPAPLESAPLRIEDMQGASQLVSFDSFQPVEAPSKAPPPPPHTKINMQDIDPVFILEPGRHTNKNKSSRPKPRPRKKPTTPDEIAQAEESRRLLEEARQIEASLHIPAHADKQAESSGVRRKHREVDEDLILSGKRVRRQRQRSH
ncbi:hypothetical protein JR316_0006505 [Psilocybe cubensis]|uniref:Uncharacterized protein n=1 Tax=Psilocybe cubensis TaxID=181762 RepID=A0ACB8H1U6_PSICU|nr:hypothetical protein JR316_0006505 [Psilocybe cubensis]KAH9481975.1 hypothetical protein JR316_0006505 [Psilocybe cubensis]